MTFQEWLALTVVVAVAATAVYRRVRRKKDSACKECEMAQGCAPPRDEDLRVLDITRHLPRHRNRDHG